MLALTVRSSFYCKTGIKFTRHISSNCVTKMASHLGLFGEYSQESCVEVVVVVAFQDSTLNKTHQILCSLLVILSHCVSSSDHCQGCFLSCVITLFSSFLYSPVFCLCSIFSLSAGVGDVCEELRPQVSCPGGQQRFHRWCVGQNHLPQNQSSDHRTRQSAVTHTGIGAFSVSAVFSYFIICSDIST